MLVKCLLGGLLLLIAGAAWAQCPYGIPNNPGCVPPDAWPQNQGGGAATAIRQPYWVYTWGALAADKTTVGASTGFDTKRQAEKAAVKDCRARGGSKECKALIAYHHQCIAAASGKGFSWAHGPDIEKAKQDALGVCNGYDGDVECSIYYTNCTEPYLVR